MFYIWIHYMCVIPSVHKLCVGQSGAELKVGDEK